MELLCVLRTGRDVEGCYMGLTDSCIGMRDVGELRDVVMMSVYEGLVNGGDGAFVFARWLFVCWIRRLILQLISMTD
jgi:hypothetical protein